MTYVKGSGPCWPGAGMHTWDTAGKASCKLGCHNYERPPKKGLMLAAREIADWLTGVMK